jgi:hypothetical protein
MNTTTTSTSTTRLALRTAIAALCFGAVACGAEQAADPAGSIGKAGSQQQSRISPRAAEHQAELEAQAQRERAEHADAERWARGHNTTEHPPGSFHADSQCRRVGHPTQGLDTCTFPSTSPSQAHGGARPGGYRFPDLLP